MSAEQTTRPEYDSLTNTEKAFIDKYVLDTVDEDTETPMPVTVERELNSQYDVLDVQEGNRIATEYSDIIDERLEGLESGDLSEDDLFDPADLAAEADEEEADTEDTTETDEPTEQADDTTDETETEAEDDEADSPDTVGELDLDNLEDYDYRDLQTAAMERDIKGNQSAEDLREEIREYEGYYDEDEADEEPVDAAPSGAPMRSEEKSYADLTPLQQRLLDHWVLDEVNDLDQSKKELEDKAGASPGYSARTFETYDEIRQRRKDAYEQGILTDDHLNTPSEEAFIDDPSVPEEDQEKLPESQQPTGTPLAEVMEDMDAEDMEAVDAEAATIDELDTGESEAEPEDTAETEEPETETEPETEPETADTTEQLDLPSADGTSDTDETTEMQEEMADLQATVDNIAQRLDSLEGQVSDASGATVPTPDDEAADGQTTVSLSTSEWLTVVRALARLDESDNAPEGSATEDEELLNRIVSQVH